MTSSLNFRVTEFGPLRIIEVAAGGIELVLANKKVPRVKSAIGLISKGGQNLAGCDYNLAVPHNQLTIEKPTADSSEIRCYLSATIPSRHQLH